MKMNALLCALTLISYMSYLVAEVKYYRRQLPQILICRNLKNIQN